MSFLQTNTERERDTERSSSTGATPASVTEKKKPPGYLQQLLPQQQALLLLPLPANCSNCQCRPANWNTEVTTTTSSQPASHQAEKEIKNLFLICQRISNLRWQLKHSELHSVIDVLLSLPDLLLLLLLSSFLFPLLLIYWRIDLVNNNKADDADDKQEHVFVFLFVFLPHSESGRRSLNKKKQRRRRAKEMF